ncbi:unnamed protein product [Oppiella nova]|uniref:Uncharacterized protein n=1 Tax=Oppiella nova TaxID=334625 RepID=A0A7R9LWQ7_9ACAR|nr:unnamed protein product [Oppiella nova]CAG2167658.1 unnamed protein product [Oppiella nova]
MSDAAINLIKLNVAGGPQSLYELMVPKAEGEASFGVEVDYIPWGTSTREINSDGTIKYTCTDDDKCLGTRLHACIARNHVSLYQNHHEFFMIYCTATQTDWKTNPLGKVIECGNRYPDIPDDGVGLELCANANLQSDPYLEEVIAVTDTLYPEFSTSSNPLVIINGRVNTNAITNLKTEVCRAMPLDNRPGTPCSTILDPPITDVPTPVPSDTVKVQVYYSPLSQKSVDFIKLNTKDNNKGIYDLLTPGTHGNAKYNIEFDYIPWGRATRVPDAQGKNVYTCPEGDTDCLGTRLHACIARNHVTQYENHHEFFMVLCTASGDNWKTNPLGDVITCARNVNDLLDDGPSLEMCAKNTNDNRYLDQTLAATDIVYPAITDSK